MGVGEVGCTAKSSADTETRICSRDLQLCKTPGSALRALHCERHTHYTSDGYYRIMTEINLRTFVSISCPSLLSTVNVSGAVTLHCGEVG